MRRYRFLTKDNIYEALNKLRAAFLAAQNGKEVDLIMKAILTQDERMKIGRRIQIAQMLRAKRTYFQIKKELKVGVPTIVMVDRNDKKYKAGFDMIGARETKVDKEYSAKSHFEVGGSKMIHKTRVHTGFKRSDVGR